MVNICLQCYINTLQCYINVYFLATCALNTTGFIVSFGAVILVENEIGKEAFLFAIFYRHRFLT